ncbi:MAG: TetR/AcrR family transcriptional regulator [Deltaproteobacteria bacterium]|nr:TetR/AcrR family transcriptional regulator [Deltaproteobacteria bacterium]
MSARTKSAVPPPGDRRRARSATTRAKVVEAMLALLEAGEPQPTAPRIAAHAGVSLRSVFQHFDDLEALFAAAAARQGERLTPLVAPLPVAGTVATRAAALAAQRARVYEAIAPVRRAALLQEPHSRAIARHLDAFRAAMRDDVARLFAAELQRLPAAERREVHAGLAVAVSFSTWNSLRRHQGLGVGAARGVVARTLRALLG